KKGIERRLAERSMEGLSCDACEFELIEGAFLLTQDDIDYINEFDNLPPDLTEEELIARIHEATGDAAEVIMTIASSLAPVPKVGLLKYTRNLYKANKAMVAAKASAGSLKNISGSLDDAARLARNQPYGSVNNVFRRLPKSPQDVLALEGAQAGKGRLIIKSLSDPRYKGWEKWHYSVGPKGSKSVVHYIRNPKTGYLTDFKFK
ncbi:MAG: hypothetical protein AAGI25_20610, partial [Bacteroidota bacterium]